MNKRHFSSIALVLITHALIACSHANLFELAPTQSSGLLGTSSWTLQTVYWLDNSRVLFVGYRPGDYTTVKGLTLLKSQLFEWNTATREVAALAALGDQTALCYDRGYVRYRYRSGDAVITKAGRLGTETEIPGSNGSKRRLNHLTCREYDPEDVEREVGPGLIPLRDDEYWGRQYKKTTSVYLRISGANQVKHVVPIHGIDPPIRWSEFANGYVFRRGENVFSSTSTTGKLWILSPDGSAKEFSIPAGPWFHGSTKYGMTKLGVFISSHAVGGGGIGNAGGYLMAADRVTRVVVGYIYAFDVSPDGCKIAASIQRSMARGQMPEVAVINLCGLRD